MPNREVGNIESLQMMLRNIAGEIDDVATVVPDGIFGPQTLESVQSFQQKYGLEPTGVVDFDTWNKIVDVSQAIDDATNPGRPVLAFNETNEEILPGQTMLELYVIQAMMKALAEVVADLVDLEITGTHDMPSVNAVKKIQISMGMEDDGIITIEFYNNLSHLYEAFVTRRRI